jgi:hypothetical protein
MAQTVSYSRGSSAIANLFTSIVTMYTNSSGYPQRVIIAGVAAGIDSGFSPLSNLGLFLGIRQNASTDARDIITMAYKNVVNDQANNVGNVEFLSGMNTQETQSFTSYNVTTAPSGYNRNYLGNTVSLVGRTAGAGTLGYTNNTNETPNMTGNGGSIAVNAMGGVASMQYIPSQFWMSPGDVLVSRTVAPVTSSGWLRWNFITITES